MFLYNVIIHIVILCLVPSKFQETIAEVLNKSVSDKQTFRNVDLQSPDSDLWLISRDDPIPFELSGRWSFDKVDSQVRLVDLGQFAQNIPAQPNSEVTAILPVPSEQTLSRSSHIPLTNYDKIITSDDGRTTSDRSDAVPIQSSGAVLVQLPPAITEGLWVHPYPQNNVQLQLNDRHKILAEKQNVQIDETRNNNNGDFPEEYLPIKQTISRLPTPNEEPQAELNIPIGQYYQVPYQTSTAVRDGSINRFIDENSQTENNGKEIFIIRQTGDSQSSAISPSEYHVNGNKTYISSKDRQSYGNVLTGEDIELLERLGILSSLLIDRKNQTNDFINANSSQREYETSPILIDNGVQVQLTSPGLQGNESTSDILLIDLPQFATAEYHSDIPENVGIHNNAQRLSPYLLLESQNVTRTNEANESTSPQISYKLVDSQLVEFLNLLGINTEDFINQSSTTSPKEDHKFSNKNGTEGIKRNSTSSVLKDDKLVGNFYNVNDRRDERRAIASTASNSISSKMDSERYLNANETVKQNDFVKPSVTNGRIQPRLLENPFMKENEVFQLFSNKAIPVSDKKIEMLKKLQIQPRPYEFGFKQEDGNGTLQHRNETSDSQGIVKGSYGYEDAFGMYRMVKYIADDKGFHAVVKTNEPGTVSHSTADAVFMSETPPLAALLRMMDYLKQKLPTNTTETS